MNTIYALLWDPNNRSLEDRDWERRKMNNKEKGARFTHKVADYFKNQGVELTSEYRVDVGLSSKYKKIMPSILAIPKC